MVESAVGHIIYGITAAFYSLGWTLDMPAAQAHPVIYDLNLLGHLQAKRLAPCVEGLPP